MTDTGTRIYGGRYEIIRKIARGGMAEVYLARDQLLDREVALKVLFPELSTDQAFVERFRREAQAAANLNHPNIVSVFDWGEEGSTYFIVLEYINGTSLSQVIKEGGPMLADKAAEIGAEVAAALSFAHQNGVVHRDVKPGNVLIDQAGHVKVADFGIARALNATGDLTQTGSVMGTATYFSPEQAQGVPVDPRSDVYSLGVVLYEMVTGSPPFSGDNPVAIAAKHVNEAPKPISQSNPSVPVDFAKVVASAMAKKPEARYDTAEQLRADLQRFRQGQPVIGSGVDPDATQVVAAATGAMAATAMQTAYGGTQVVPATEQKRRNRKDPYIILLCLLLGGLALLLFFLGRNWNLFGADDAQQVTVPNVIGKSADEAASILEEQGLEVVREEQADEADEGTVFDQDPKGGEEVDSGSEVTIFVSGGEETVEIPDVVGKQENEARSILVDAGFNVRSEQEASDKPEGEVIDQEPDGGNEAPEGSEITIVVSSGVETATVPSVRGQTEDDARQRIEGAGFQAETQFESSNSVPQGRVIRTSPSGGSEAKKGSTVVMIVSSGPQPTTSSSNTTSTTT